jgi:hypothetical protein
MRIACASPISSDHADLRRNFAHDSIAIRRQMRPRVMSPFVGIYSQNSRPNCCVAEHQARLALFRKIAAAGLKSLSEHRALLYGDLSPVQSALMPSPCVVVAIGRGIQFSARPKAGYYADFGRVLLSGDAAQMGVAPIISNCCTASSPPLDQCPLCANSGSRRNQISGIDSSARRARCCP